MLTPTRLDGALFTDDRGGVGFVNEFAFRDVRRFYFVRNHRRGFVRAWHGHKREAKYFTVVAGTAKIGAVAIDDWETPSRGGKVWEFVLTATAPGIVHVPAGFANGFMSLTTDTVVVVFSTATLAESQGDDFRFPARHWDIWSVEER